MHAQPDAEPPQKPPSRLSLALGYVALAVLAAAAIVGLGLGARAVYRHVTTKPTPIAEDQGAAVAACEDFARLHLKAPATARFIVTDASSGGGQWLIDGTVDAENGFGALVRAVWHCQTHWNGSSWVPDSVDVNQPDS